MGVETVQRRRTARTLTPASPRTPAELTTGTRARGYVSITFCIELHVAHLGERRSGPHASIDSMEADTKGLSRASWILKLIGHCVEILGRFHSITLGARAGLLHAAKSVRRPAHSRRCMLPPLLPLFASERPHDAATPPLGLPFSSLGLGSRGWRLCRCLSSSRSRRCAVGGRISRRCPFGSVVDHRGSRLVPLRRVLLGPR